MSHAGTYGRTAISDEDRNALVEDYLPLVRHVIGRLPLTLPAFIDQEDLFEVGVLGLMNAARTYDASRGAAFKTHAYVNVRGAILDELRRFDVVPRSRRDRIKLFHRTSAELEDELGRTPTASEIADAMGLTVEQVDEILVNMHAVSTLSLDDGDGSDEGGTRLADCVACMRTPDPGAAAENRELQNRVTNLIFDLPDNERRVMVLYYSEGLLLKEIGEVLGVSESRVCQIHGQALARIRAAVDG